jgi:hypothetical protein
MLLTKSSVDFAKSELASNPYIGVIADSIAGQAAKFSMDLKPKEWPSFMDNVSLPARSLDKLTVKEGKKTHVYEDLGSIIPAGELQPAQIDLS